MGAGGSTSSYEEAEHTDFVFLWGSNAREAHPIWFHHLLKGIQNGATLYVVDPRRTSSAAWADTWLGLNVGSDIALANTMAREIIHAGLHDVNFIERGTTGFEAYRAAEGFRRNLAQHGRTATGIFSCSKSTNEVNFLASKFARQVFGNNNVDSCNRT